MCRYAASASAAALFAGLVPFGAIASALLLGTGRLRPADLAGAILVAAGVTAGVTTPALGRRRRRHRDTVCGLNRSSGPPPGTYPTSLGYRRGGGTASLGSELPAAVKVRRCWSRGHADTQPLKRGGAMRLLAIGRPRDGADVHQIARYAREEMRALWQLYRDGVVREMYSPGCPR